MKCDVAKRDEHEKHDERDELIVKKRKLEVPESEVPEEKLNNLSKYLTLVSPDCCPSSSCNSYMLVYIILKEIIDNFDER